MTIPRYALVGDYEMRFPAKPRGASLTYTLDFAAMLIQWAPAVISAVVWSVVAVPNDGQPLTIAFQSLVGTVATVQLARGTPLTTYAVRGQVAWSDGETDVVEFVLPIMSDANLATVFPIGIPSLETFGIPVIH